MKVYKILSLIVFLMIIHAQAFAFWTNEGGNMNLIGKIKSQATWRAEDAPVNNPIPIEKGNLISQRNLVLAEYSADFGDIGSGFKSKCYVQGRIFYDGAYDYGAKILTTDGSPFDPNTDNVAKWKQENPDYDEVRRYYTYDNRDQINELKWDVDMYMAYLDLMKGGAFLRAGRQVMAWGEMSTLRVLEGTNPLDTSSLAVDLLERRIPLWMLRANYAWAYVGPFDSLSFEGYYINGKIDNTYEVPMIDGSPILPSIGRDTIDDYVDPFSMASLKLNMNQVNSDIDTDRFGFKLGSVFKGINLNLVYYRMYSDIPVPWVNSDSIQPITVYMGAINPNNPMSSILGGQKIEIDLTRDDVNVYGGSFNYQWSAIDTVFRGEFAYFEQVPFMTPGKITDLLKSFGPKVDVWTGSGPDNPGQQKSLAWLLAFYARDLGNIDKMILPFSTSEVEKYDQLKYGIGIDKFYNFGWLAPKKYVPVISDIIPGDDALFKLEYIGSKILGWKEDHLLEPWYEPWDDNQDGEFDVVYWPEYSNTFILITRLSYLNGNLIPQLVVMYELEPQSLVFIPSIAYSYKSWDFEFNYFLSGANNYTGTLGMMDQRDEISVNVTYSF
jgi:hypothetical protein